MLRVLTLFEVPLIELFEVGSQFRFRSGVERVGTGTGNRGVAGCVGRGSGDGGETIAIDGAHETAGGDQLGQAYIEGGFAYAAERA